MPLTPEELAPGRRVRNPEDGATYDVRDGMVSGSGGQYLMVTEAGAPEGQVILLNAGLVRDEWETRDPADDTADEPATTDDNPTVGDDSTGGADVSGVPGVTDPRGAQGTTRQTGPSPQGQSPGAATDTSQTGPAATQDGESPADAPQTNA